MNQKLFQSINKKNIESTEKSGLPDSYPIPCFNPERLFYIQRSQNLNTVIYEINRLHDGSINRDYPINVFWVRYSEDGKVQELNYIQNKLAYGYDSQQICTHTFQFELVSYRKLKFYIDKIDESHYAAFANINEKMARINNIYVYAEDYGLFPDVKYIELFGSHVENNSPAYQRIYI